MLVLSRKADETIVIDGQIRIKILGVKGNKVRIGIEAPQDITICRGEIAHIEVESPQHCAAILERGANAKDKRLESASPACDTAP